MYWVLPVETGALRGNESNSAKEISNPTKEKEVTTHHKSKAAGIPSQWPCGKARRLQPQAQRPQLRCEERGEHRRGANPAEPVLGLAQTAFVPMRRTAASRPSPSTSGSNMSAGMGRLSRGRTSATPKPVMPSAIEPLTICWGTRASARKKLSTRLAKRATARRLRC